MNEGQGTISPEVDEDNICGIYNQPTMVFQVLDMTKFNESVICLAEKLGVEPGTSDGWDYYLNTDRGSYSVMALVNAFLDKMNSELDDRQALREVVATFNSERAKKMTPT